MPRIPASVVLLAVLAFTGTAAAQARDPAAGWAPRSGDPWIDAWLGDVNRYGDRYRDPFVDELVRYRGAPRGLVEDLLARRDWTPGDVYMACSIAAVAGRPCRAVAETYARDRSQGWGGVARQVGIQPGSAEFHRLKQGFVPTYDRWGRPIVLDAELQRAFPRHPKGSPAWVAPAARVQDAPAPGQGSGQRKRQPGPAAKAATSTPAARDKPHGKAHGKPGRQKR